MDPKRSMASALVRHHARTSPGVLDVSYLPSIRGKSAHNHRVNAASTPVGTTGPELAHYLSLLSGAVRLRILRYLANGPSSVGAIAARLGVSIGLVSHNLKQLREAGLVTAVRRSRQRIYGLDGRLASPCGAGLRISIERADGGLLRIEIPRLGMPASMPGIVQTQSTVARTILARRQTPGHLPDI